MPFVQAGPVRLEYFERGSGPRAWVLVHGYRSSARIWDGVQTHLAAAGFRTLAISMRGAGASDVTPDDADYAPANFARDLHAATEALGVHRFLLLGHSLGASTVTHYVRDHADRVEGLVLLAGGPLRARVPLSGAERAEWLKNIEGHPGNINREHWEAEHAGLSADVRARLWEDWQRVPPQRLRGVQALAQDLEPVVRAMTIPTLVMFGDEDRTVPPGGSAECYLALPAEVRHLHVFHGVDHSPNGVIPQRVSGVLARFAHHVEEHAAAK